MNTDLSELTLMQLSDSFFPSGLYTMSNGLETIFDEKRASSEGDVYDFLEVTLEQQLGPADSVALSNAYDCAKSKDISGIIRCDDVLYSMKLIQESVRHHVGQAHKCSNASSQYLLTIFSNHTLKKYLKIMRLEHILLLQVCAVL